MFSVRGDQGKYRHGLHPLSDRFDGRNGAINHRIHTSKGKSIITSVFHSRALPYGPLTHIFHIWAWNYSRPIPNLINS